MPPVDGRSALRVLFGRDAGRFVRLRMVCGADRSAWTERRGSTRVCVVRSCGGDLWRVAPCSCIDRPGCMDRRFAARPAWERRRAGANPVGVHAAASRPGPICPRRVGAVPRPVRPGRVCWGQVHVHSEPGMVRDLGGQRRSRARGDDRIHPPRRAALRPAGSGVLPHLRSTLCDDRTALSRRRRLAQP